MYVQWHEEFGARAQLKEERTQRATQHVRAIIENRRQAEGSLMSAAELKAEAVAAAAERKLEQQTLNKARLLVRRVRSAEQIGRAEVRL